MKNPECPFKKLFDVVNKKWSMLVLATVGSNEVIGFNGLKNALEGITSRALSELLKVLEDERLLEKERIKGIPPRVHYSLSPKGKDLLEVLKPVIKWAANETYHQHCEILSALQPIISS